MVASNLKAETKAMMEKRAALEMEMDVIIQRLCQPGGPGLSGNLVDSEGFPRSDIDVQNVRADRKRLFELRNDYKDITEKINASILFLHSSRIPSGSAPQKNSVSSDNSASSTTTMNIDVINRPFAIIDEISEASPAADDGLQLGDQIMKFGNVESCDNLLQRLAAEAQTSQGHPVAVLIMRQGGVINLTVTPRVWQGRGLLGCHFRII